MNRRAFIGAISAAVAAAAYDPERLLWVPGQRTIFDLGSGRRTQRFCISMPDGSHWTFDGVIVSQPGTGITGSWEVTPQGPVSRHKSDPVTSPVGRLIRARAANPAVLSRGGMKVGEIESIEQSMPKSYSVDHVRGLKDVMLNVSFKVVL